MKIINQKTFPTHHKNTGLHLTLSGYWTPISLSYHKLPCIDNPKVQTLTAEP